MGEGIEERNPARPNFSFAEAARFWERQRVWYNTLLGPFVALWVGLRGRIFVRP